MQASLSGRSALLLDAPWAHPYPTRARSRSVPDVRYSSCAHKTGWMRMGRSYSSAVLANYVLLYTCGKTKSGVNVQPAEYSSRILRVAQICRCIIPGTCIPPLCRYMRGILSNCLTLLSYIPAERGRERARARIQFARGHHHVERV